MSYVADNPKTKKQVRKWLAEGRRVYVFEPKPLAPIPANCTVYLEGPHFPQPHRWYAQAKTDENCCIVSGTFK